MLRKIVNIDEAKCDGCGECVPSCAEGAIKIIAGKAKLVSDVYCDGLGACLGHCPQNAITMIEREADPFDLAAVHHARKESIAAAPTPGECPPAPIRLAPIIAAAPALRGGNGHACPGSAVRSLPVQAGATRSPVGECESGATDETQASRLSNWPLQLNLVPPQAPFLRGADLLLAADCVPFAYADFHRRFLGGRPVLIGCPKLDNAERYVQKLAQILLTARPLSVTVLHMEVPCCTGLARIAEQARLAAQSDVPLTTVVVSIRGEILNRTAQAACEHRP